MSEKNPYNICTWDEEAEESKTLHCLGNNGAPKPWRYRPGPMNNIEKFIFPALLIQSTKR